MMNDPKGRQMVEDSPIYEIKDGKEKLIKSMMEEGNNLITKEQCPRFDTCNANLCPFDPNLANRTWYPDEDICIRKGITEKYRWIKIQRRTQKKVEDQEKYFVVEMLENLSAVGKGTIGLNPDSELSHEHQLAQWLKYRKKRKKREYTEEEKEILRGRIKKARRFKN